MASESRKQKDPTRVSLRNVRLSYPNLFTPRAFARGEGKPAFSASALIPKDTKAGKALIEKIEDAIAEANRLPFGLAGYAFTTSLKNAHLLAQRLEVGMLWINQAAAPAAELPFGGLKDSGYGSEGGSEAVEAHLNTRLVSIMNA